MEDNSPKESFANSLTHPYNRNYLKSSVVHSKWNCVNIRTLYCSKFTSIRLKHQMWNVLWIANSLSTLNFNPILVNTILQYRRYVNIFSDRVPQKKLTSNLCTEANDEIENKQVYINLTWKFHSHMRYFSVIFIWEEIIFLWSIRCVILPFSTKSSYTAMNIKCRETYEKCFWNISVFFYLAFFLK